MVRKNPDLQFHPPRKDGGDDTGVCIKELRGESIGQERKHFLMESFPTLPLTNTQEGNSHCQFSHSVVSDPLRPHEL